MSFVFLPNVAGHMNTVGYISFVHTPVKESEKYFNTIFFFEDPQGLQLVVLGHVLHVILYEVVDVFAKEVQVGLS